MNIGSKILNKNIWVIALEVKETMWLVLFNVMNKNVEKQNITTIGLLIFAWNIIVKQLS